MFRMRTLFAIEPHALNASGGPMKRQTPRALIGHAAVNTRPSSVLKDRRQAVFPLIQHLVEFACRFAGIAYSSDATTTCRTSEIA